jgi:hypothetical protein
VSFPAEAAWRNDRLKFAEVKFADRAQRLGGCANPMPRKSIGETAMTDAERQALLSCPLRSVTSRYAGAQAKTAQLRFLKRQLSLPVSMMSQ